MSRRKTSLFLAAGLILAVATKDGIVDTFKGADLGVEDRSRPADDGDLVVPAPTLDESEDPVAEAEEDIRNITEIARASMRSALQVLTEQEEATNCDPNRYILNVGPVGIFSKDFLAINLTKKEGIERRNFIFRDMSEETITNVDVRENLEGECGDEEVSITVTVLYQDMTRALDEEGHIINSHEGAYCSPEDDPFAAVFSDIDAKFEKLCN